MDVTKNTDKGKAWVADNFVWLLLKVTITLNVPGVVGTPVMRQDIWVGTIGVGVEVGGHTRTGLQGAFTH